MIKIIAVFFFFENNGFVKNFAVVLLFDGLINKRI